MQETSAAFVTMTSRVDQTAVASGMLSYREDLWVVDKAPEPTEVIWRNVAFRGWERSLRSLLSWGIFSCLVVFMLPIITFITQLVNIQAYAKKEGASGAWARWILNIPFLSRAIPRTYLKVKYMIRALCTELTTIESDCIRYVQQSKQ